MIKYNTAYNKTIYKYFFIAFCNKRNKKEYDFQI